MTAIAHNLIGYTQDAGIKLRNVEGRIVGSRGGTTRWNKVLNNIFFRCGKAIDFSNPDNTTEGNPYLKDWGGVTDESKGVGRGLNWISGPGTPLLLELEAWQNFFGFDKNGAYAGMSIDVDLDALTMTWSFSGSTPQVSTAGHSISSARPPASCASPAPCCACPIRLPRWTSTRARVE
jgi:hypothetical protein